MVQAFTLEMHTLTLYQGNHGHNILILQIQYKNQECFKCKSPNRDNRKAYANYAN